MNDVASEREPTMPEMLAIAENFGKDAVRRIEPDDRFIYGIWGVAWLAGFTGQWLTAGDEPRLDAAVAAGWLFTLLIAGAVAANIAHVARRARGLHGPSADAGRRYAAAWAVAFLTYGLVLAGLERAGTAGDVADLVAPLLACFIVGLLYMAGGAVWNDRLQFGIGAWISVCVGVGAVIGVPDHNLVLAIGGGGGLLAGAVMAHRRRQVPGV